MTATQQDLLKMVSTQRYRLYAYSTPLKFEINLKRSESLLGSERTERATQQGLVHHMGDDKKVFIFSFGSLVFFNVPSEEHEALMLKLGIDAPPRVRDPETDEFAEDRISLEVRPNTTRVGFNGVTVPDLDPTRLQLIAQVLAQSSALELIEWEVDEFLAESEKMTGFLRKSGWVKRKRQKLLQFLGEGLTAKHKIVNQLALFSEPEKAWEQEDFYHLYLGLFDNFDMKERIETIEKKLNLCSEVTELLLDIENSRRAEILELTIIFLILFEIVNTMFGH